MNAKIFISVILVVIIVGAAGFFFINKDFWNKKEVYVLDPSDSEMMNSQVDFTKKSPDNVANNQETIKKEELKNKKPVKILSIEPIKWTEGNVDYTVSKVFLIQEFVDMGPYRENPRIKGKNFLVFDLKGYDNRTEGVGQKFDYMNFFRLKNDGLSVKPEFPGTILALAPQEGIQVYPYIPVASEVNVFSVQVGLLSVPNVMTFDFSGTGAQVVDGEFYLRDGLKQ